MTQSIKATWTAEKLSYPKPIRGRKENQAKILTREILTALNNEIDGETHFCLSLVDIPKKLSPRKDVLAKSKIMSLLVELMDDWTLVPYI